MDKMKTVSSVPEDEAHRVKEEIQTLTDLAVSDVVRRLGKKHEDIMKKWVFSQCAGVWYVVIPNLYTYAVWGDVTEVTSQSKSYCTLYQVTAPGTHVCVYLYPKMKDGNFVQYLCKYLQ